MSQAIEPFHVLGAGVIPADLPPLARRLLESADLIVGGRRLLEAVPDIPARTLPLKPPLESVLNQADQMRRAGNTVVVLADGDPGFYGIGDRLRREFGAQNVVVYPNVTVLQAAAARMNRSWERIETVSLHGRSDSTPLLAGLSLGKTVGVYTDAVNTPAALGRLLLDRAGDEIVLHVFENLGGPEERLRSLSPSEAASIEFSDLNFLLAERIKPPEVRLRLGLSEAELEHEAGLLTKREIRAAGLSGLQLESGQLVWDIGAGCGSVSIEAAALAPGARIVAVEQNERRAGQIRSNVRRTGALTVEVLEGRAPECLSELPDPDRVFVGGGLGRSEAGLLESILDRLKPGGRMVLHLVLLQSLQRALAICRQRSLDFELQQIQISRAAPLAEDLRLAPLSPVFILTIQGSRAGKVSPEHSRP